MDRAIEQNLPGDIGGGPRGGGGRGPEGGGPAGEVGGPALGGGAVCIWMTNSWKEKQWI